MAESAPSIVSHIPPIIRPASELLEQPVHDSMEFQRHDIGDIRHRIFCILSSRMFLHSKLLAARS